MRKKLILFDWGNIVESYNTGYTCSDAYNDWFRSCGYKGEDNIFTSLSKYKLTSIPTLEAFEKVYYEMAKDFNLTATYEEFIKIYKETLDKVDYYKDVADYEKSLRNKCYIGILSNLTIFDKERLDKQVDLSKYDYAFLSFEMSCKKPFREIYEKVSNEVPFNNKDILFIDDRQDNIDMAKEFGWNTLKATGLELDKIKLCCEKFINEDN